MGDQNIFAAVLDKVRAANEALIADGVLPVGIDQSRIVVEPPRESAHGDMATNAAMVLAKGTGSKPRALAEAIAAKLRRDDVVARRHAREREVVRGAAHGQRHDAVRRRVEDCDRAREPERLQIPRRLRPDVGAPPTGTSRKQRRQRRRNEVSDLHGVLQSTTRAPSS